MTSPHRHIRIADRVTTRLKLKQLRLLVAIASHASLVGAAREMNISQPAATKLLKDLEDDFDVRLFERTNRGVVPTVFGHSLIRHGRLVLAQISNAAQELDDLSEGSGGTVLVGTLLAASARLLPAAIHALHLARPQVTIRIREGTNDVLMPLLSSGELDLVVGRLPAYQPRPDITQEHLLEQSVCVVARPGHPLFARAELSWADLNAQAWILPPRDTTLRAQIDEAFLARNLPPLRDVVESVSFLTNRELLMGTDLLGVFPSHVVERELNAGLLRVIDSELMLTAGPIGVSYRREGGLSPAANVFLELLRGFAAAPAGPESNNSEENP